MKESGLNLNIKYMGENLTRSFEFGLYVNYWLKLRAKMSRKSLTSERKFE